MDHESQNELPLGARVLPGVDLRLWLLVLSVCFSALAIAVLVRTVG
jgi:hypothetical protein